MQTTSQPIESGQRPRSPKRGPEDGNILWRLYQELGYSARKAFWENLGISKGGFSKHSAAGYSLGRMDTSFFFAYRDFFLAHGGHDILEDYHGDPLSRSERAPLLASHQYHENEGL